MPFVSGPFVGVATPPGSTYHETYYSYNALGERVSELDGIQSGVGPVLIINDGNVQRSQIDSLTVEFQKPVTLSVLTGTNVFTTTGAFTLANTGGTAVAVNYSNPSGDARTWVINFTNGFTAGTYGSLPDGGYSLTVVQSDTSGAGAPSSDKTYTFARLYGDFFGSGTANFSDLVYVVQHYNQTVQPGMWYTNFGGNPAGTTGFNEMVGVEQRFNHTEGASNSGAILMGPSATQGIGTGKIMLGLSPQEFYYSVEWQILEQDKCNPDTGSMQTASQNVWGLAYVNELVLRDSDSDGSASTGTYGLVSSNSGLDQRLYAEQDANFDVVALVGINSGSWQIVQRYDYDAQGNRMVLMALNAAGGDAFYFNTGWQGGLFDQMTGRINFQRRDYDPVYRIWVTEDPTGTQYADGMNLYQMERLNSASQLDPTGLKGGGKTPDVIDTPQQALIHYTDGGGTDAVFGPHAMDYLRRKMNKNQIMSKIIAVAKKYATCGEDFDLDTTGHIYSEDVSSSEYLLNLIGQAVTIDYFAKCSIKALPSTPCDKCCSFEITCDIDVKVRKHWTFGSDRGFGMIGTPYDIYGELNFYLSRDFKICGS